MMMALLSLAVPLTHHMAVETLSLAMLQRLAGLLILARQERPLSVLATEAFIIASTQARRPSVSVFMAVAPRPAPAPRRRGARHHRPHGARPRSPWRGMARGSGRPQSLQAPCAA